MDSEVSSQARWVVVSPSAWGEPVCVNECPQTEKIPRLGSFGTYQNMKKKKNTWGLFPASLKSPGAATEATGRTPTMAGLLHLSFSKAKHPLRADFASWQLWSNIFCPDSPLLCLLVLR